MKVSGILLFILILSGFSGPRCGATVYYSNGSVASVQQIHNNQAQNGDTITLPAGTFVWTTGANITKAITLQGAGVGVTIIRDGVQNGRLINWMLAAGNPSRITGIEFQDGGRIHTANAPGGILGVVGSNTNGSTFRMDHCKWNDLKGHPVFETVIGVIDHNSFVRRSKIMMIYVYDTFWNGQDHGDGSWAAPTNFGSSQFLFIEDNNFTNNGANNTGAVDALGGARFVLRHNTFFRCEPSNHGTESGGRIRGCRAMEIYGNTFTSDLTNSVGGSRSGSMVFHDNVVNDYWNSPRFNLGNWRNFFPFRPWGGADGTNPWDVNDPRVFFTGRAAANSSGTTVTVSGANWTPNQWVGYTLRRTTNVCNSGSLNFGWIWSNTSNRITYTDNGGYKMPSLSFCAGDALQIRKVDHALDQPGTAPGSLPTPDPPVWNNQVIEPCYSWNNTNGVGGQVNFSAGPGVRANEHYFNNTPMPGYVPYTYPHPLVSAGARALVTDVNGDGSPDFVLQNAQMRQTAVWYLNNNVWIGSVYGPTLPNNWGLRGAADFNDDRHSDYVLLNPITDETAIWYLSGPTLVATTYGPSLPSGWELVATADFNGDGHPDYLIYNASTHQTAIWYLNNNVWIGSAYGPTLPNGWNLIGVADFNRDGHMDYALFNPSTGLTAIWYLSGPTLIATTYGPSLPSDWILVGTADFNGDGYPDYVLYNASTHQTAIWYLNNKVWIGSAYGPTLPAGWSLIAQ